MTTVERGITQLGPWRLITEDDLLYCVLFSGEGQPHTNEPYSNTQPFKRRMFYGDGSFALAYTSLLQQLVIEPQLVRLERATVRYTARVFIGDRVRIAFEAGPLMSNVDGSARCELQLRLLNHDGDVVLNADLLVRYPHGAEDRLLTHG